MGPGCGHGHHGAVLEGEGRVHLEYACPVWHSSLTVAQRMAMVAMAGWNPSHIQQLLDLGLHQFSVRRD